MQPASFTHDGSGLLNPCEFSDPGFPGIAGLSAHARKQARSGILASKGVNRIPSDLFVLNRGVCFLTIRGIGFFLFAYIRWRVSFQIMRCLLLSIIRALWKSLHILLTVAFISGTMCSAQSVLKPKDDQIDLPVFLAGTWKSERVEVCEHWDVVSPDLMMGFSYSMKDEQLVVSEFLEIRRKGKKVYYSSTVLNQNAGKQISFRLSDRHGSQFTFTNPKHDFPQIIFYEQLDEHTIGVKVTGGAGKGFAYRMHRIPAD